MMKGDPIAAMFDDDETVGSGGTTLRQKLLWLLL